MGAQHWSETCGVCHVGGGSLEYDRDQNEYGSGSDDGDRYVMKYAELDDPNTPGIDETSWDNVTESLYGGDNKAEVDCLMCHLDSYNAGSSWLQTMECGPTNQIGPMTDANCTGTPMFPGTRTVEMVGTSGVTQYDMYNRNYALKQYRLDLAASMGAGAIGVGDVNGTLVNVNWGDVNATIAVDRIQPTPLSEGCAVCHARDDNTIGLPGMITMKTGFGNFGLFYDPSNQTAMASGKGGATEHLDTDNGVGAVNDDYWFDFGCKTGMGKRSHKINATGDTVGTNARYGMSMFMPSTLDMNPATVPNAGDPIPGKMPDADVHDTGGMQCATCHYSLGSNASTNGVGKIDIPATTSHGFDYPAETVYGMDHLFAQSDSLSDTKGKNNLDGTVSCESCHTTRTHPNLTDNGGTLVSTTPTHPGFPLLHFDKIGCVTCHIPETYAAPARLKYRDWSAGFWRTEFKNVLDWNYDLVTASHKTLAHMRKWVDKGHGVKIYPFQSAILPTWFEQVPNTGVIADNAAGMTVDDNLYDSDTSLTYPSPVKNRDSQKVAEWMRDTFNGTVSANNPGGLDFDIRLNGGNTVPLFDGFQMSDSWEIDTKAEIDAMLAAFQAGANGSEADNVEYLNVIQAVFDTTHGVVPKEWALGGDNRGGCVSCHSSMKPVLSVDMTDPNFMAPNPDYSPNSIGFFEGYSQPVANAGLPTMGVGGMDVVKNWMALFADFDAAQMCAMGNPAMDANDTALALANGTISAMEAGALAGGINGQTDSHNYYFDSLTGEPNMYALCDAQMSWFSNNPMFGTAGSCMATDVCGYQDMNGSSWAQGAGQPMTTYNDGTPVSCDPAGNAPPEMGGMNADCNQAAMLQHVVGMMTMTFDQAMGFPSGTAAQMGMYDGIAGLQGFVVKELQTQGTLGCNGFAGPVSFSPMAGVSVNNCMPDYVNGVANPFFAGVINGTCVGAAPPTPGACDGGFRNHGACFADADCSGAMQNAAEIGHNPLGLIYGRAMVKSHMKIDLQQSYATLGDPSSSKVKWGVSAVNRDGDSYSWDQAQYCYDYMTGPNPMMPNVIGCSDLEGIYAANAAASGMCSGNPAGAPPSNGAFDCQLHIVTAQSANQYLGYSPAELDVLMSAALGSGPHPRHATIYDCTTCHFGTTATGDGSYDVVGDTSVDVNRGPGFEALDLTYFDAPVGGTCTNNCHNYVSAPPAWGTDGDGNPIVATWDLFPSIHVKAYPSDLAGDSLADSPDWNEVILQGERSTCCGDVLDDNGIESCEERTCSYSWAVNAACTQTGGDPNSDTYIVSCGGVGDYNATLTVTDVLTNKSDTAEFDIVITSSDVNPLPDPTYTFDIVGNNVTVDMSDMPGNIVEGYVYWGDGTRTKFGLYQDISLPLPGNELSHLYDSDPSGNVVRIKIFDHPGHNVSQVSTLLP